MKQATVFLRGEKAGILTEDENGYTFQYDLNFLYSTKAEAISLTLPLTEKPYNEKVLFPFFDGLIPEGWLLNIAENNWKIDSRDRMSLLLACCKDCIGAVGHYVLAGNGIVPYAMGGPFEQFTITNLVGAITDDTMTLNFMCGEYPVTYSGTK